MFPFFLRPILLIADDEFDIRKRFYKFHSINSIVIDQLFSLRKQGYTLKNVLDASLLFISLRLYTRGREHLLYVHDALEIALHNAYSILFAMQILIAVKL